MRRGFFLNRFWARSKTSEDESARCGRCASVLPDETLTFCPKCGTPFSRVPPTLSFQTISSHLHRQWLWGYRLKLFALSVLGLLAFGFLGLSFMSVQSVHQLHSLHAVRPVAFYIYEDPAYPQLDVQVQINAIASARQSFYRHFGIELNEIHIYQNQLPQVLVEKFPDVWSEDKRFSLSFWEKQVYPRLPSNWQHYASRELPVLLTNIPIVNHSEELTSMETSHLGPLGLVSGLGHPALTIVSSFRAQKEQAILFDNVKDEDYLFRSQMARFLGEYLIAHELGHAMLALPDFVVSFNAADEVRGPASSAEGPETLFSGCLMHTDQGGGYQAWFSIRDSRENSKLYSRPCAGYGSTLRAFKLRTQAIEAIHEGRLDYADRLYQQILSLYGPQHNNWLRYQIKQEHQLVLSSIRRWW